MRHDTTCMHRARGGFVLNLSRFPSPLDLRGDENGEAPGFHGTAAVLDLLGRDVGQAEVHDLSGMHEVVQGLEGLVERTLRMGKCW